MKNRMEDSLARLNSYLRSMFLPDVKAGFITAIVALPLGIAFAIASGVPPVMGLYTAIVAGILGSLLGGSRFSITGPTGAMTVIILSIVHKFGIEGLLMAGLLAGAMQVAFGLAGVGKFVKFIPLPIISGFTSGIGVLIFLGQVPAFLGLSIPAKEHIWETMIEIFKSLGSVSIIAVGIALSTIAILLALPRLARRIRSISNIPPTFVALILSTWFVFYFGLAVPQVGDIPQSMPTFDMLHFDLSLFFDVLPSALTIAILGLLEALLCAVVCDGMTNTSHDSNKELISQGIANIAVPFFGGIPATAAVARSAVT